MPDEKAKYWLIRGVGHVRLSIHLDSCDFLVCRVTDEFAWLAERIKFPETVQGGERGKTALKVMREHL